MIEPLTPKQSDLAASAIDAARRIARRYARKTPPHVEFEQLLGPAHEGLVEAASAYDESIGPFINYAAIRVSGAIRSYLCRYDENWDRKRKKQIKTRRGLEVVEGWIPQYDPNLNRLEEKDAFDALLGCCSDFQAIVLRMYYEQGMSMEEIARACRRTGGAISQQHTEALKRIRRRLTGELSHTS